MPMRTFLHICLFFCLAASVWAAKPSRWDAEAASRKAAYTFIDAQADLQASDYTEYAAKMGRALALDPSDIDISAEYAEMLLQTTGLDSAEAETAYAALWRRFQANTADYANAVAVVDLADKMGKYDDMIAVWRALQASLPGRNDPSMNLADTYMVKYVRGDSAAYDSAMAIYNRLEEGIGFDLSLLSHKIRAYAVRSDSAAIDGELTRIRTVAPTDPLALRYAGQVYESFGMPDKAMDSYNAACELDSTDGQALMLRANLHLKQGDSAAYDTEVFRALESQNLEFDNKLAMLTGYIRALFEDSTQHARIDRLFEVLDQVNPGQPELHALNAMFLAQTDRPRAAVEQVGYAVDLDPDNEQLWGMYLQMQSSVPGDEAHTGVIDVARRAARRFPASLTYPIIAAGRLSYLKRYPEAFAVLDSVDLSVHDSDPEALSTYWATRGDVAYGAGRTDSSAVFYERAINLNPRNYMAMNNYAYHLAVADSALDRAEHYSALAVKSDPENPTYLDTYAWVLFRKGEYTLARQYIDAVLRLYKSAAAEPTDSETPADEDEEESAEVLDHAGDIYFMTGDRNAAYDFWRRAAALDPDNALIAKKIKHRTIFFE